MASTGTTDPREQRSLLAWPFLAVINVREAREMISRFLQPLVSLLHQYESPGGEIAPVMDSRLHVHFSERNFPLLRYLPEKFHPFVVDPIRNVFITTDDSEKLELINRIKNLERNANLESDHKQLQGKCAEVERLKQICSDENRQLSADCTLTKAQASIYDLRVKVRETRKKLDKAKASLGIAMEVLERDIQWVARDAPWSRT
ncbi:uncharacterized protein BT62DRAFT_920843 [Guyanagaster necrorhizus]|uniref:Uncharacterized protein n=1 Tax=Guyanagaster necrorhizus TaxID=856835 RepID=A0A9P8AR70_9AGAR|nr:uncharacterized protein BT62DRAFT_920843 [Guyanagaster necrorhizus MCA 3950]KAG7445098.1 hypothetical protein BT62DRAFT_920843 [Guyanagaster necrorhizus MCA 3950]